VLLANDSFGQTALESMPYAALTLFAQLEVLMRMGQMALESLVYVVDRLYASFDVDTNFGHTALESLTYVEFKDAKEFDAYVETLLANVADDAVALRDVSVNVDALITMPEDV